ncbi:unnamed protein product [Leptosia nina]|uniref:Transcription elongation factor, mitochondrial n=1 Tax=Leptosia nina TaxID=320188 RepID=A0AAV1J8Y3_9NEOP
MLGVPRLKSVALPLSHFYGLYASSSRWYSESVVKYSEVDQKKILEVINKSDIETLSRYDVTKGRVKNISKWKQTYGPIKSVSDIETIDGFNQKKEVEKLFDSIVNDKVSSEKETRVLKHIKGQILKPPLAENTRQAVSSILTVYVTINSVSWALIEKSQYKLLDWQYHGIEYTNNKNSQLGDILEVAWNITNKLPSTDIYVMKGEATSLRASGSDPNNPKMLGINLQKAQMISMIVALLSARNIHQENSYEEHNNSNIDNIKMKHTVYFLRPSLPFRLYGTLIGKEQVTSDQTVEMLLQNLNSRSPDHTHVYVPDKLKALFRAQRDLPKDMMAQCLLFSLTFMDLCIYKNKEKIDKMLSEKSII